MVKRILLVPLLALVSLVLLVPTTYAESAFDNAWQQTNTLKVSPPTAYSNVIPETDITLNYMSYIMDSPIISQDDKDWLQTCLSSPTGQWYVTQEYSNIPGQASVDVVCGYSSGTNFTFGIYDGAQYLVMNAPTYSAHQYLIQAYPNGYSSTPPGIYGVVAGSNPQAFVSISQPLSNGNNYKGFLANGTIVYPSGYEGPTIPSTYNPVTPVDVTFSYKVQGLILQVHSTTDLEGVSLCQWVFDTNPATEVTSDISEELTPDCSDQLYTYAQTGTYYVKMQVTKDGSVSEAYVSLKIDGTSYSGSASASGGTTDTGYENCGSTDIPCVLRNFVRWVFVPDFSSLGVIFSSLQQTLRDHLGFLWYPFDWLVTTYTKAGLASGVCYVNTSDIPGTSSGATFFGHTFNLNLCQAQTEFPSIWNISVFFIQAVTVFGLIFGLYRRLEYILMERPRETR